MVLSWALLSLLWHGTSSFMVHNTLDSLCLQDSSSGHGVTLRKCNLDNDFQQWVWQEQRLLRNVGTQRCLSAFHEQPALSLACDDDREILYWGCETNRLLSLNRSLELSSEKGTLRLTPGGPHAKWKSLDIGDICQERQRSKRASDELLAELEEDLPVESSMNQEQREFLKWFYRTEDQSKWTFAMLGLSFAALLLGCVLLVMGMMGSRSRKKIAKYKAAALALKSPAEELQVIIEAAEGTKEALLTPPSPAPPQRSPQDLKLHTLEATENGQLKPGEIVVTWKDGTVSSLYEESGGEEEEGEKEENGGEEHQGDVEVQQTEAEDEVVVVEEVVENGVGLEESAGEVQVQVAQQDP